MVAPVKGATAKIQELISWFSVSIHVPVKGATDAESWAMRAISGFNPRTRKGCDIYASQGAATFNEFQSTHP